MNYVYREVRIEDAFACTGECAHCGHRLTHIGVDTYPTAECACDCDWVEDTEVDFCPWCGEFL